jgi:hypothetical protein
VSLLSCLASGRPLYLEGEAAGPSFAYSSSRLEGEEFFAFAKGNVSATENLGWNVA